jgi:CRP-like cAMP-binding protein
VEGEVADAKVERLRQIPLFKSCDPHALADIAQLADEVDVADGYTLIREGTFGEQFILIIDGHVRIERGGQTVRVMGPGEFLGEIALIDKGRTTATATTEGPARLFIVGHGAFNSLLDQSPAIRLEIITALAKRVRQLEPADTPLN